MRPTFVQTCALLSSWRRRAGRARARDHGRARRREKGRLAGWEGRLEAREWAPQSDTIRPCTLHTRPRTSTDPPNEASLLCAGHFTLAGALLSGTGGELLPLFFRRPFYGPRAENQQERAFFLAVGSLPAPFGPSDSPATRQMPTDASGKGSADAASVTASNRLTKTQLDAILNLAAAGDVEPKEETTRLDARGAASPVHIAIWDPVNEVKLSGADAPTTESLADFLKSHPNCEVFAGQKPSGRAATERSGLDKLVDASGSPSTLGDKHLTLREHAAFSQGGEEPTKRSMYTPEQLQRLQVRNATSPCASAPTMFLRAKAFGATACVRTQVLGLPSSLRRRSSRRASCPARSSARYRLGHTLLHRAAPCYTHPAHSALLHSTSTPPH